MLQAISILFMQLSVKLHDGLLNGKLQNIQYDRYLVLLLHDAVRRPSIKMEASEEPVFACPSMFASSSKFEILQVSEILI